MSDARTKQERSRAKDARQSPAPDVLRIPTPRKVVCKPFEVFMRMDMFGRKTYLLKRFATREQAWAFIRKELRTPYNEDHDYYVVNRGEGKS